MLEWYLARHALAPGWFQDAIALVPAAADRRRARPAWSFRGAEADPLRRLGRCWGVPPRPFAAIAGLDLGPLAAAVGSERGGGQPPATRSLRGRGGRLGLGPRRRDRLWNGRVLPRLPTIGIEPRLGQGPARPCCTAIRSAMGRPWRGRTPEDPRLAERFRASMSAGWNWTERGSRELTGTARRPRRRFRGRPWTSSKRLYGVRYPIDGGNFPGGAFERACPKGSAGDRAGLRPAGSWLATGAADRPRTCCGRRWRRRRPGKAADRSPGIGSARRR